VTGKLSLLSNVMLTQQRMLCAKIKSPSRFGIIKPIPNDLTSDDVKSFVPNCSEEKAKWLYQILQAEI